MTERSPVVKSAANRQTRLALAAACPLCGYVEQMPISLTAASLLLGAGPHHLLSVASRIGLPARYRRRGRHPRRHRVFRLEDLRQLQAALGRTHPSFSSVRP